MGPRLDNRSPVRLGDLRGVLHSGKVSQQELARIQEIREGSREAARLVLQLHLSRGRNLRHVGSRDRNLKEAPRSDSQGIQPLLSRRHETLRQRSSFKPSQLLHIPQHRTVCTKPVAEGYCCERVRPDGRRKNVEVAREHSSTTPSSG